MDELRSIALRDVLSALGFSGWKERKSGTEWYGKCPIHKAVKNSTSFSFSQDGRFNCFSCSAKGRGAIDLVMKLRNCNFKEATQWLQSLSGTIAPASGSAQPETVRTETYGQSEQSQADENQEFHGTYSKYSVKSSWLSERGLSEDTLNHYGVFEYNNPLRRSIYSGRVMLPMRRFKDGACVGYLARSTEPATQENPKYLLPKGVAKHLEVFGSWELKNVLKRIQGGVATLRYAFLVESPFCVMKFAQMGFPAVSCYGWSVSPEQADILAHLAKGWLYLPDADKRTSAIPGVTQTISQKCWVKCPEYPADDPEHLSEAQVRSLI